MNLQSESETRALKSAKVQQIVATILKASTTSQPTPKSCLSSSDLQSSYSNDRISPLKTSKAVRIATASSAFNSRRLISETWGKLDECFRRNHPNDTENLPTQHRFCVEGDLTKEPDPAFEPQKPVEKESLEPLCFVRPSFRSIFEAPDDESEMADGCCECCCRCHAKELERPSSSADSLFSESIGQPIEHFSSLNHQAPGNNLARQLLLRSRQLEQCKVQWQSAKGILRDTREKLEIQTMELMAKQHELKEVKSTLAKSVSMVDAMNQQAKELSAKIEALQTEVQNEKDENEQLKTEKNLALQTVHSSREECQVLSTELDRTKEDLANARQANERSQQTLVRLNCEKSELENQVEELSEALRLAQNEIGQSDKNALVVNEMWQHIEQENADLVRQMEERERALRKSLSIIKQGEILRRRLHNTVQDLTGKIRVVCRLRPPLLHTEAEADLTDFEFTDAHLDSRQLSITTDAEGRTAAFSFDRVFAPASTQDEVYNEIADLVQSALDGFRVCIFAYGQTSSGKTFTMSGPTVNGQSAPTVLGNGPSRGVIPRAMEQIFSAIKMLRMQGWEHTVTCQYVQIYNEIIQDLLLATPEEASSSKHELRHTETGEMVVSGVTEVTISEPSTLAEIFTTANRNRSTRTTLLNDHSSRSHSVFTLKVTGSQGETGERTVGVLNLIDLAGSERLKSSKAQGDPLRETQCINKSLACLGDVIAAIARKAPHIPYRNSKLTHMLEPYLGGKAKILMFVNVSPLLAHLPETMCSLRFAEKVNSCEVGVAKRTCFTSTGEYP